jgi:hypothetical protein
MRILRMFLVIAAVGAMLPMAARAQESRGELVNRLTSWMTIGAGSEAIGADGQAPVPITGPPRWLSQDPYCAEDLYCEDGQCGYCNNCCRQWDVFGSAEMLLWWAKGNSLPPLLTTAPVDTVSPLPGALNQPDTVVLFGNEIVGKNAQAGGRATVGIWLDPEHNVSLAARVFGLGGDENRFTADSTDFPFLLRPFIDGGASATFPIGFPGLVEGNFTAVSDNNNVFGVEAISELMLQRDANRRLDLVFGYQLLRVDDSLSIDTTQILPDPATIQTSDIFTARNEFHGGTLGFHGRIARGVWSIDALGKVGIGSMRQRVQITGETIFDDGVVTVLDRGFLALPSNIGIYERNKFAFIPEATLNLKYHVSRNLNFHVGYNLLWISHVATTGRLIDLNIDLTQADPLPAFVFRDDDYWLQGINFGMNWDF